MTKTNVKRNKKEEQKKLMVRIICIGLVAALLLTSGLAMASWIFQDNSGSTLTQADIQEMIDQGILTYDENGNLVIADTSALTLVPSEESHEGHDHE